MKKLSIFKKNAAAILLSAVMAFSPLSAVGTAAAEVTQTTETTDSAAVKNGWVKEKAGYCYYENGKQLKGLQTIKGKTYFFGSDGARKTGWYSVKNKSYYFDSKGVLKKTKTMDKTLLASMDKAIKAQKIIDATAKKTALKKLFTYCSGNDFGYARVIGFNGAKGWEYSYAKKMLSEKKGSCYHFAAAYAFLAKRATGYPVRICWGTSNAFNTSRWQNHAWVEIKVGSTWYTYDPNAAKFSSLRKGKWYQQKRTAMEGKVYKTQKYVNVEL